MHDWAGSYAATLCSDSGTSQNTAENTRFLLNSYKIGILVIVSLSPSRKEEKNPSLNH